MEIFRGMGQAAYVLMARCDLGSCGPVVQVANLSSGMDDGIGLRSGLLFQCSSAMFGQKEHSEIVGMRNCSCQRWSSVLDENHEIRVKPLG